MGRFQANRILKRLSLQNVSKAPESRQTESKGQKNPEPRTRQHPQRLFADVRSLKHINMSGFLFWGYANVSLQHL